MLTRYNEAADNFFTKYPMAAAVIGPVGVVIVFACMFVMLWAYTPAVTPTSTEPTSPSTTQTVTLPPAEKTVNIR